jgi:hypothetical protein
MKVFIILCLVFFTICNENASGNYLLTLENKKSTETTSVETSNTVESSTYALGRAKMDDFYVQNSNQFKTVQIVEHLPPKEKIGGDVVTVDGEEGTKEYYDGSRGLKISTSYCNNYTTQPEVCMHQGSCGWCGSTNSCVTGNNLGPLAPCLRGTYRFTAPKDWNLVDGARLNSVSQREVEGAKLTTFVSQP